MMIVEPALASRDPSHDDRIRFLWFQKSSYIGKPFYGFVVDGDNEVVHLKARSLRFRSEFHTMHLDQVEDVPLIGVGVDRPEKQST